MINKNTVVAKTIDMLEMNKDKEIAAYLTSVIYADNEGGFIFDGDDIKLVYMYLTLTGVLANKQNISIHEFLQKVEMALSKRFVDVDISLKKEI